MTNSLIHVQSKAGRPVVYPDTLFLKALVVMTLKRLYWPGTLLAVLEKPSMQPVRRLLTDEKGRFPSRRTWERRLRHLPESLPERIGLIVRLLVEKLNPWARRAGRAVAFDPTCLHAGGGVWYKKDREKGHVPDSRIDTDAHWTKSGYHGWVYGWKLHLAITVAVVWIPLAARLRPANEADNIVAKAMIYDLPLEAFRPWRCALQCSDQTPSLPVARLSSGGGLARAVSTHR